MRIKKAKRGISLVMFVLSLVTIFGFAALALDLGSTSSVQNELQKATTTAALAGAAAFNPQLPTSANNTNMTKAAQDTFDLAKSYQPNLSAATIIGSVDVDTRSGAVRLQTRIAAPTFFIALIGINTMTVEAQGGAINYPFAYKVMNDLSPLAAATQKPTLAFGEILTGGTVNSYTIGPSKTNKTIRLVALQPIINNPGPEISVLEAGDLDGYEVMVSNNASGPWYTITKTGKSFDGTGPGPQAFPAALGYPADRMRFFGSGTFDLTGTGIENARYLAIVDDGLEDGYLESDKATYLDTVNYPTSSTADSQSATFGQGADIDQVLILQHSIAIPFDDLSKDSNGDSYIDDYNTLYGTYSAPGKMVSDNAST